MNDTRGCKAWVLAYAFALVACGDAGGGETDDAASSSGTTADPATGTTPPDDTTGPTEPDDTTTTTTTTAEDTTDATTSSETSSGSDDSTSTSDATSEGTSSESSTGVPGDPYLPCFADDDACAADETCVLASNPGGDQGSACGVLDCEDESDCPPLPIGGDATSLCLQVEPGTDACVISCEDGETCPDGMVCVPSPGDEDLCVWPEPFWTCALDFYGDASCDCGCGLPDLDCPDVTIFVCEYCNDPGSCNEDADIGDCSGILDPANNAICDLTQRWTCNVALYDDGVTRDCGCGWPDPDCVDDTVEACDTCNDPGSCAATDCASIEPDHNSTCAPPPSWTCFADTFDGDDGCNCGCGAFDPDCDDATADACTYCNDPGSCAEDLAFDCTTIDALDNATCI
jgi:hypothetical protein